ncbi:MAG: S9 family peptidase [Saprospiraceae bacterium]|nr:S9 family peptidase [Saprospiraceae bacterium]
MKKQIILFVLLILVAFINNVQSQVKTKPINENDTWQKPPKEIMDVLNAPLLPAVWTSPTGKYMIMADPIIYPPLEELASDMLKLAGIRVNPRNNGNHGEHGGTSPRIFNITNKVITPLSIPQNAEVIDVKWTVDGQRFALSIDHKDHIGLWIGDIKGNIKEVKGLGLNKLLGTAVTWLPDQKKLLLLRIPKRGNPPVAPAIPKGPEIKEGKGAVARSTYESRNLLETAHDGELFTYYATSEPVIYDPEKGTYQVLGASAPYTGVEFSPSGNYILVERLVGPWSNEVAYWRFAQEIEIWDKNGNKVSTVASIPLADAVPVQGVPMGARSVGWRATSPNTLFWIEALDGGNPVAEVTHRDKLMSLEAPFTGNAKEVFRAEHRIVGSGSWGEKEGMLMLTQWERKKRWVYVWLLDVDKGTSRIWFDLNQNDSYNNPGNPLFKQLANGQYVMREKNGSIYFSGSGASDKGNRPFLDLKELGTGKSERLFRCDTIKYEYFVGFAEDENNIILRSESTVDVPNYYLGTFGNKKEKAKAGEAERELIRKPITNFADSSPELRKITKKIVKYQRDDGVQLSFQLNLPPNYVEGQRVPTVLYAYPLEYSGASEAGQVSGSDKRFMRIYGPSHMFFLLQGYAVLDQTAMPMIGDPETTYNTFVPQLVADAEAAVKKAVEMGVADPERIGVIGHSHGALMVANLLAHSDLFKAGIARSGSYNKTNQPFGFQSERRSLFEARDVYIQLSPTFFADKINEPILIIHGNDDSNPGTLTYQSEVLYEAVRGSGGTARLVLLPHEDHGYSAKENIEHVLWEQLRWFDKYLKGK